MDSNNYTDDQRASNRRSVLRVGLVLLAALLALVGFGQLSVAGFAGLALGVGALVSLLWWLFASAKAEPLADPGPEGRRAVMMGALLGFFTSK